MRKPSLAMKAGRATQQGAALFVALILLVAITLVSLASLGTSLLELRMSNNTESAMSAVQGAQSGLDNVIYNADLNLIIAGNVNDTNCTTGYTPSCNRNTVSLPSPFSTTNKIQVTRTSDAGCPPRTPGSETSCAYSKAASFTVHSTYDRSTFGQGKAELYQGYIKLYPTTPGSVGNEPTAAQHN